MEPKNRQLVIRRHDDRWHRALEALRLVDSDVGDLVVLQESHRALGVLLVEPAPMAELDRDRQRQARASLEDQLPRLAGWKHPLRKLDEDRTQLFGFDQRLERASELLVYRVEQLLRHVLAVDALLLLQLVRQLLLDRLRQARDLGRLARHERVGLDIEHEILRRALDPALRRPLAWQHVIRRVDLDHRELAGGELEAVLRRAGALRVEHAGGGHRRVGPARRAEPHLALAHLDRRAGRVAGLLGAAAGSLYAGVVRVYASHSVMKPGLRWMSIWRRRPGPALTKPCGCSASTTAISPGCSSCFACPSSTSAVPSSTISSST